MMNEEKIEERKQTRTQPEGRNRARRIGKPNDSDVLKDDRMLAARSLNQRAMQVQATRSIIDAHRRPAIERKLARRVENGFEVAGTGTLFGEIDPKDAVQRGHLAHGWENRVQSLDGVRYGRNRHWRGNGR